MMKKLALLAMMVLGSTSIASAGPFHTDRYDRSPQTSTFRTDRYERSPQTTPFHADRYEWSPQTTTVRDHRTDQSWNDESRTDQWWDEGEYDGERYNVTGYYLGPAGNVKLVQRGNRIYGTFANGGQMNGVVEHGKITYTWTGAGYHGRGYWNVAGNGQLIGMWGANDSDSAGGNWNLTLA